MDFNKLIPELSVSNISKSIDFYVSTIGFRIEYARPGAGFAFLSLDSAQIMLEQDNGHWKTGDIEYPRGRGVNFQIEVRDLKSIYNSVAKTGHPIFREISEKWRKVDEIEYGEIEFLVLDPDGYLLRFSESIGTRVCHDEN